MLTTTATIPAQSDNGVARRADGTKVPGYAFGDQEAEDAPTVIMLQEWWGVDAQVMEHAGRLADDSGYRVVIPDLYRGKIGVTAEVRGASISTQV